MQQPVKQPQHKRKHPIPGIDQRERQHDECADGIADEDIAGKAVGPPTQPFSAEQQRSRCIEQYRDLVQHVFARHDAESAACVQPASVKAVALHGQRPCAHRRNVAEHAEKRDAQRVSQGAVRLFVVNDDKAHCGFHRLVGNAEHNQEQNAPERYGAQVFPDAGQRVAENEDHERKNQCQRKRADKIGVPPFPFHCRFPPVSAV